MNRLNLDDPKLTAFALGELEGQEAIEMAKQIENDPAAKRYVEEIRGTEQVLKLELAKEDASARLPLESREKILGGSRPWYRKPFILIPSLTAAAAVALVVANANFTQYQLAPIAGRPTGPSAPSESKPMPVAQAPQEMGSRKQGLVGMKDKSAGLGAETQVAMEDESLDEEQLDAAPEAAAAPPMNVAAAPKALEGGIATTGRGSGASGYGVGGLGYGAARDKIAKKAYGTAPRSGVNTNNEAYYSAFAIPKKADTNTERYSHISENGFKNVKDEALSTFSIDVDTASYANVRRYLTSDQLPPTDAVRLEELLNYFKYSYPQPTDGKPFSVTTEVAQAPWNAKHQLVRIGLKGREIPDDKRPASNLVFLIDTSGSMLEPNKLPLVQKSMKLLVEKMRPIDHVSIVTYAGDDRLLLDSTSGKDKDKILTAIDQLSAGGGTNGAAGINSAYKIALSHFIKGGVNRVILSTDGDFNVGVTSESDLLKLAEEKAKSGVFLTVLGFGTGNYNDSMMVKLADKGNGNHAYIDNLHEAKKVLVEQAGGTLQTIAKDVKIQVEFNPRFVSSYRLVGYEKRMLAKEDFNDDTKDAGEIGAGHTVTALYEIVPTGTKSDVKTAPAVDALKYQPKAESSPAAAHSAETTDEMLTVKLRYKKPDGQTSEKFDVPVRNESKTFDQASGDMKFASAVAGFGMLLRNSEFKGDMTWDKVVDIALANAKVGGTVDDNRIEFMGLVRKAKDLSAGIHDVKDPSAYGHPGK